jgi:hypothetical protein
MPNPAGGQGSGSALELLLQKKAEKGVAPVHLVQGSQVYTTSCMTSLAAQSLREPKGESSTAKLGPTKYV